MMTKEQQDFFKKHALISGTLSLKIEDFAKFYEEHSKILLTKIKIY